MPESLRGHFLVAGKSLRDSNFFQTVVLILDHGEGGALGVVVNRPTPITVAEALSDHFDLPPTDVRIFYGGPVESSALFILHDAERFHGEGRAVMENVFVGSDADEFEGVIRAGLEGEANLRFRVFSGCAGWGAGQLDGELARADWHVVPADADTVFAEDPYSIWEKVIQTVYRQQRLMPGLEGEPGMN